MVFCLPKTQIHSNILFYFSGFPNFPVTGSSSSPPSYDSSISSYDAPILDDNSYTAKV